MTREWNGRYNAFHCVECQAFVRVTAIWINGLGEVQRVEGMCWRHGEVAVEGWGWDDLGIDESAQYSMRIDTNSLVPSPALPAVVAPPPCGRSNPSSRPPGFSTAAPPPPAPPSGPSQENWIGGAEHGAASHRGARLVRSC